MLERGAETSMTTPAFATMTEEHEGSADGHHRHLSPAASGADAAHERSRTAAPCRAACAQLHRGTIENSELDAQVARALHVGRALSLSPTRDPSRPADRPTSHSLPTRFVHVGRSAHGLLPRLARRGCYDTWKRRSLRRTNESDVRSSDEALSHGGRFVPARRSNQFPVHRRGARPERRRPMTFSPRRSPGTATVGEPTDSRRHARKKTSYPIEFAIGNGPRHAAICRDIAW